MEEETDGPHDGGASAALWLLQHSCETGQTERYRGNYRAPTVHVQKEAKVLGFLYFFINVT